LLALLNENWRNDYLDISNATLNYQPGDIAAIPIITDAVDEVEEIAYANIKISRSDRDAFETSWDFKKHPLICTDTTVAKAFAKWEQEATERFDTLKANEEELNRIFIDIYDLQDELTPDVEDKDVTVRRADLGREIRSLISYAVGCMFGRYSLDCEGLAYAGGEWDASKYSTLIPDKDNILPFAMMSILKTISWGGLSIFIRAVYGTETLEEKPEIHRRCTGRQGYAARGDTQLLPE
jgi:hypothetical protein